MRQPNSDTENNWVIVGQLGSPHGVKGWIRLNSFTEPADNILDYQPWFFQRENNSEWEPLEYEKVEYHAKGMIILLKNINDRNVVATYTLTHIAIPHSQLPILSESEYYWNDLEGLKVMTQEGVDLGQVDHLFATGSNDVLVVKGAREHLIPYLMNHTVLKVDLANKCLTVDWDPEF